MNYAYKNIYGEKVERLQKVYDNREDGNPPINLLAFKRWFEHVTKAKNDEALSRSWITIDAELGCQDVPEPVVKIEMEIITK
jgi:hypothetical protein